MRRNPIDPVFAARESIFPIRRQHRTVSELAGSVLHSSG